MTRRILIVVGHPDTEPRRFCRALAQAYAEGAESAGHQVRRMDIAELDFPLLRTMEEFAHGTLPPAIKNAAQDITAVTQRRCLRDVRRGLS